MNELVDAHCHVDLFPDPSAIIAEIDRQGIHTIAVTNAPSVFDRCHEAASSCSTIYPAIGLHPELVASRSNELPALLERLSDVQFVGEIGLDYQTKDDVLRHQQRSIFESILNRCAETPPKVLTVHSRRSSSDVLAIIGDRHPSTIILHWFSGSLTEVDVATERGLFFSVNPAMVRSQKGQALIARMPRDRVVTETDGPFVTIERRPARPDDVVSVLDHLADVWKCSQTESAATVRRNFEEILRGSSVS